MKRPRRRRRHAPVKARALKRGGAAKPVVHKPPKAATSGRAEHTVARALREVERAQEALVARGVDLLAVVHRVRDEATEAERAAIAREITERFVLRDTAALRDTFGEARAGSLPEAMERLRNLPAALLDWIEDRFEIVQHLERGQKLDVPQSALTAFTFEGEPPPLDRPLVQIVVMAPGWKRRASVLVRPTASWVT